VVLFKAFELHLNKTFYMLRPDLFRGNILLIQVTQELASSGNEPELQCGYNDTDPNVPGSARTVAARAEPGSVGAGLVFGRNRTRIAFHTACPQKKQF
jgi:hypothetical protein